MSDLIKSGDKQQYEAVPHKLENPDDGVIPEAKLIWMTPDPLGAMAFFSGVYKGRFYDSLDEVTDEDRYEALADVQKTHLQAPLEVIKMHFRLDGVDRAFTHQLVRQRTAVYAQESMRFSVLGDLIDATTLPPSLAGTVREWDLNVPGRWEKADEVSLEQLVDSTAYNYANEAQRKRMVWDYVVRVIDKGYHYLVEGGMPAEEARGLLPQATATRINYITDLRNMKDHAGNRLCTQAQFHWRKVFNDIVREIATYPEKGGNDHVKIGHEWQFKALAQSNLFRPVCYELGRCPFQASFDRACSIRDRVEMNARIGRPSSEWHEKSDPSSGIHVAAINPAEWLLDPGAARL